MKIFTLPALATMLLCTAPAGAQTTATERIKDDFKQNTTLGGYVIGKASVTDQHLSSTLKSHSDFDLRLVRLYAGGKVWDIRYNLQMEVNGVSGTAKEKGPRIVDAWAEWCKYKFVCIKFGQFKRGFTFENPMHPWNVGFGAYSQLADKLAGFNDRVGEHTSGGRDVGLQLQGDLFDSRKDGHSFLHYQVGVYNGQGINHTDENRSKDVIGGLWVAPIKDLAIGAFGWSGSYTKNGVTVDRNRMSFGVRYEAKWSVRAEYATSQGHKISDYVTDEDGVTTVTGDDRADAWYVALGAPVTSKLKVYGKWDVYRDDKTWGTQKSIYGLSANYYFLPNLKLQVNYTHTFDKAASGDPHYNVGDVQLYWRF